MENTRTTAQTIDLWMKYCWNFKQFQMSHSVFGNSYSPEILKAFTEKHIQEDVFNKWQNLAKRFNSNGTMALLYLWHELDSDQQNLIANWLDENYKG